MSQLMTRAPVLDLETPIFLFRLRMLPAVPMTQDQFFDLCQQNDFMRLERTAEGELIIMPPAGFESGVRNVSVSAQVYNWAKRYGAGKAGDSSCGFDLPNGATRSPDASWVSPEQLALITAEQMKKFLPLCPFFVAEILSPSDSIRLTLEKMEEYIANGAKLGWFINPRNKQVHVFRPGREVEILENPKSVSGDPELPGFVLDMEDVWRP